MQIYPPKKKKKSKFYLLFLFLFFLLHFLKKRRKKNFIKIKMVSTKTIDGNGNLFLLYIYIYIYIYIINNFFLTMMGFGFCTWEIRLFIIIKRHFIYSLFAVAYSHMGFSSSWLVECWCQHEAISYSLKISTN